MSTAIVAITSAIRHARGRASGLDARLPAPSGLPQVKRYRSIWVVTGLGRYGDREEVRTAGGQASSCGRRAQRPAQPEALQEPERRILVSSPSACRDCQCRRGSPGNRCRYSPRSSIAWPCQNRKTRPCSDRTSSPSRRTCCWHGQRRRRSRLSRTPRATEQESTLATMPSCARTLTRNGTFASRNLCFAGFRTGRCHHNVLTDAYLRA
jgi:hypothetical protein